MADVASDGDLQAGGRQSPVLNAASPGPSLGSQAPRRPAWKALAPTSVPKGGDFTPTFTKWETDREVACPHPRSPREKIRGPGGSRRGGGQTQAPVRPPVDWWTWPLCVTQSPEPEPLGLSPPGPLGPLGLDATDLLTTPDPGGELDLLSGPDSRGGASWAPETPKIEPSKGHTLGSPPCLDLTQQISQPALPPLLQSCHTPAQLS